MWTILKTELFDDSITIIMRDFLKQKSKMDRDSRVLFLNFYVDEKHLILFQS